MAIEMSYCNLCHGPLDGPSLIDTRDGGSAHPACVGERLPEDVIVALLAAVALVLVPTVIVWAG